jgi:hypothetical protein
MKKQIDMKGIEINTKTSSYLVSGHPGLLWTGITVHKGSKMLIVYGADYEKFETFKFTDNLTVGDVVTFKVVNMEQPSHTFEIQPMMSNEELLKEYYQLKQELEEAGFV